jgi:hypothetical protein
MPRFFLTFFRLVPTLKPGDMLPTVLAEFERKLNRARISDGDKREKESGVKIRLFAS